jgi:hypothetical protein
LRDFALVAFFGAAFTGFFFALLALVALAAFLAILRVRGVSPTEGENLP